MLLLVLMEIFNIGAFAVASELCEWFQIKNDVNILSLLIEFSFISYNIYLIGQGKNTYRSVIITNIPMLKKQGSLSPLSNLDSF